MSVRGGAAACRSGTALMRAAIVRGLINER
jgi:hypothetical protein